MSYFNPDDLNYIFTPQGHQDAIDRAEWDNEGFANPTVASDGSQQASSQPAVDMRGVVQQQLQQQESPQPADARFDAMQRQIQGVVQERDYLRNQNTQLAQQEFLRQQAEFKARVDAETDPKRAVAMVQDNANQVVGTIAQTYQQHYQQQENQMRQALMSVLVDGFTQTEVFARYPNLTEEQKDLLTSLPDPDQRAQFAAVFSQIGQNNQQNAASAAAALHVASGAGRVGGVNPNGGTAAGAQGSTPGRPRSAFDVLRDTPYSVGGYGNQ